MRAVSLDDEAGAELRDLATARLLRVPRVLDGRQGVLAIVDGVEVVSFASNDYLGLAGDSRLADAAIAAIEEDGVGVGSSRLIVGNHREHAALETELGDWMKCGGVRLFNSGYAANVGVLTTLLRAGDVVFSDELDHASIIDGCRLSRAEVVIYPHRDLTALERALRERTARRKLVVSESVFSMDGDIADVEGLAAICRRADAALVLDEAHALGIMGPEGRGIAAGVGVVPDVLIGTFGKALGTFGAFTASGRAIADLLWNRARPLVFSTGLPPSVSAATRAALQIVRSTEGEQRRKTLEEHAHTLRKLVATAGGAVSSAIAPVMIGDDRRVVDIAAKLFDEKYLVASVRPPTVPSGTARLRISLSAAHVREQMQGLATLMQRVIQGT